MSQNDKIDYFYGPYRHDYHHGDGLSFDTQQPSGKWGAMKDFIINHQKDSYGHVIESIKKKHQRCKRENSQKIIRSDKLGTIEYSYLFRNDEN